MESDSEWAAVSDDPDPARDLGYRGEDWTEIAVEQRGSEHRLFMPPDEDDVYQEAFLIVEAQVVVDLEDER